MEMKYKVGDKVRIVSKWKDTYNVNHEGRMDKWLGKIMTIRAIEDNSYRMEEDLGEFHGNGWEWFPEFIDCLAPEARNKLDLSNWDVVLFRNGKVGIYNGTLEMFILNNDGWVDSDNINNNLICHNKDFDIIAIRRPKHKHECRFNAFEQNFGNLIYERKEPEEMTLEEVCRLLGKEIKIVKSK